MNLKALFNFNFLKENVRKSKGLLAFLLGVIPIINIIFLIVLLTTSSSNLLEFDIVSFLTYAGIIFIPLSLSVTLFGFVLKKKSVDFILSKPISRKSLFITNTLGGILVILVFMIINTLIFGLFGLVFESLTIPFGLLVDYFLFWFISYVFMFTVINLAIVLSGNLITSIVVALIILLIVPYLNGINYITQDYYSGDNYIICENPDCKPESYYCYNDDDCEEHLLNNEYRLYYGKLLTYNFTAPLVMLNEAANNNDTFYNSMSLIKMIVLSVIYFAIGYFVFKNRKMENNETSFKSSFAHYLVKGITLFPICLLTYAIVEETGAIGWLISIVGIIIYSVVYDLITRREIYKPVKSLIISALLFFLFTGVYASYFKVFDNPEKVIKKVDSITYEGMKITDTDLINNIIKSLLDKNTMGSSYVYNFIFTSGNTQYEVTADINETLNNLLQDELNIWNKEKIKKFDFNRIHYMEYNDTMIPITKELKNIIKDNIHKIDEFDIDSLSETDTLYLYSYHNHHYESVMIPIKLDSELFNKIITYQNELFIKFREKIDYELSYNLNAYDSDVFSDEDYYVFDYVIRSNMTKFINYLKNDNKIDANKDLTYIRVYDMNKAYTITISDVQLFKGEFDSYKENLKDNKEYQRLVNNFREMQADGVYSYEY